MRHSINPLAKMAILSYPPCLGVAKALGIKLTVEAVDKGSNYAEARLGA